MSLVYRLTNVYPSIDLILLPVQHLFSLFKKIQSSLFGVTNLLYLNDKDALAQGISGVFGLLHSYTHTHIQYMHTKYCAKSATLSIRLLQLPQQLNTHV